MAEPIMSPDGNFMWTGTEWIPAPPSNQNSQSVNLQDSVVAGDINASSTNSGQSMNMHDSVVAGDVNIVQNIGVDGDSVVSMMIAELEKLDHNKSGIHVPEGGLSTSVIIAGIDEIKQNLGNLNRFSTEHLLELCTALMSIGHSDLMVKAGKIALDRVRKDGNRRQEAKANLLIADGYELNIEINAALFHAQEALKIAKEIGAISIETEALFTNCILLSGSCKSLNHLVPRIEELLGDVSSLNHSHLAYLLCAKSIAVKYDNRLYSEQLAKEAYNFAKLDGDLKLQITTGLMMVDNEVHKIEKSDLIELNRQCSLNNFPFFSILLEFAIFVSRDENSFEQTLSMFSKIGEEGEKISVPMLIHMGEIFPAISNFSAAFEGDDIIGELGKVFEETRLISAIRIAIENAYFELVDELLFIFAIARISGYTNQTIQSLVNANREIMGLDKQLYIQIIQSIDRTYSLDETYHLCRELNTDTADLAENKSILRTYLSISPLSTGSPPNYLAAMPTSPPPNHPPGMPTSPPPNHFPGMPTSPPPNHPPGMPTSPPPDHPPGMPTSPPPNHPPGMPTTPPPNHPPGMPTTPPPGAPMPMPQSPSFATSHTTTPNISSFERLSMLNTYADNENWSALLNDSNLILANRNQLEQVPDEKWIIAEALGFRGIAYFSIGNFNAAIPDLEEAVNRKKFAGDFDNEDFEDLISIAKRTVNEAGHEYAAEKKSGFRGGMFILFICLVIARIALYSLK